MEICCSIGNRQVSDGHKLLAFASDRQMQASVAPDRLTAGEGNSRATWVVSIDIKLNESARVWRIWRNRQRWRRRCTHLPLATGDSIYPVGGNLHFLFFFFCFSFKFCKRVLEMYVLRAYTWGGLWCAYFRHGHSLHGDQSVEQKIWRAMTQVVLAVWNEECLRPTFLQFEQTKNFSLPCKFWVCSWVKIWEWRGAHMKKNLYHSPWPQTAAK